jgi:hypothetical protein
MSNQRKTIAVETKVMILYKYDIRKRDILISHIVAENIELKKRRFLMIPLKDLQMKRYGNRQAGLEPAAFQTRLL